MYLKNDENIREILANMKDRKYTRNHRVRALKQLGNNFNPDHAL